ncbi:MAG TPA: hypothetical protein VFR24_22470 [Candidatus Angelobacter sp.]|nr:hypothetical protein [Candidatus Angelobacter sp.]
MIITKTVEGTRLATRPSAEKLSQPTITNIDPEIGAFKMNVADLRMSIWLLTQNRHTNFIFGQDFVAMDPIDAIQTRVAASARKSELQFAKQGLQLSLAPGRDISP